MNPSVFNAYKIVVVGSSGVGKTALVQRLTDDIFTGDSQSTIGVEFKAFPCRCGDDNVKLNIWDTAGQEKFRSVSKAYFRNAVGAILVFSITDRQSFDDLDHWLNDLQTLCLPNAAILLVGNKIDLVSERVILETEIESFRSRHGMEYFETSALDSKNVSDSFIRLANLIHYRVNKGEIVGTFQTSSKPPISINQVSPPPTTSNSCC